RSLFNSFVYRPIWQRVKVCHENEVTSVDSRACSLRVGHGHESNFSFFRARKIRAARPATLFFSPARHSHPFVIHSLTFAQAVAQSLAVQCHEWARPPFAAWLR